MAHNGDWLRAGLPRFDLRHGCNSSSCPEWFWGPFNFIFDGHRGKVLSPEISRKGRAADHSPPSYVEVQNDCCVTSVPEYVFVAWVHLYFLGIQFEYCLGYRIFRFGFDVVCLGSRMKTW
jgi:hypothetical protein